jgi:hypothetical protein
MEITCFNDKNTWKVTPINIAAAKLRFALGFADTTFICPKCGKGNDVSKAEFQAAMNRPEVAATPAPGGVPSTGIAGKIAASRPPVGPGPAMPAPQRHGVVIVRSLHVRKDHSTTSETMAGLRKGDKVTVIGTWTDGKNTWAQLGPDRWAAIIYNDEPLIEISD